MRLIYAFLLLSGTMAQGSTLGDSLRYLSIEDSVFLEASIYGDKYLLHRMEPQQTLYSLAKFYGMSVQALYYYNPGLSTSSLRIGQIVRVPIPNRAIRRYQGEGYDPGSYIPVFYRVKHGDTMYKIAKKYFRMEVEELMMRNQLFSTELKSNQLLHVGWMNINGIPEDVRGDSGTSFTIGNQEMIAVDLEGCNGREKVERGVAHWVKDKSGDSGNYALHRKARVNSIIAVTNPMNHRTVYVKVIGKLSDRAYEDNVKVVLSPRVARQLGAVDARFHVRVTYCR